jgi:hypothetical protein
MTSRTQGSHCRALSAHFMLNPHEKGI